MVDTNITRITCYYFRTAANAIKLLTLTRFILQPIIGDKIPESATLLIATTATRKTTTNIVDEIILKPWFNEKIWFIFAYIINVTSCYLCIQNVLIFFLASVV